MTSNLNSPADYQSELPYHLPVSHGKQAETRLGLNFDTEREAFNKARESEEAIRILEALKGAKDKSARIASADKLSQLMGKLPDSGAKREFAERVWGILNFRRFPEQ